MWLIVDEGQSTCFVFVVIWQKATLGRAFKQTANQMLKPGVGVEHGQSINMGEACTFNPVEERKRVYSFV